MRLEISGRKEGSHIVQKGINVGASIPNRYRNIDTADRITRRGECSCQREGSGQLGLRAANTTERCGRLGSRPRQSSVVFNGNGFTRADIADAVRGIRISGEGLSVDGQ